MPYKDHAKYLEHQKKLYKENRERYIRRSSVYQKKNVVRKRLWNLKWYRLHKSEVNAYNRKRYSEIPEVRILNSLRCRIRAFLKGKSKSSSTRELVGCSREDLKVYLEARFTEGMTWENHALDGWHIDHILPPSRFDLSDPEEQVRLFHYTNLQPMWGKENLSKSNKLKEEAL